MTPETLREAVGCSAGNAILYAASLTTAMVEFGIETPEEQATFLSETAHESMLFSRVEENFNYTPGALLATFNTRKATRVTPATAQRVMSSNSFENHLATGSRVFPTAPAM